MRPTTPRLLRAIHLIALSAVPAWVIAHPLVTHELKHDQSSALRYLVMTAKSSGAQAAH